MILPPENISYNSDDQTISWDSVPDVDGYQIEYQELLASNWDIAYTGGLATECPFNHDAGVYRLKGKSIKGGVWGIYGQTYEISII